MLNSIIFKEESECTKNVLLKGRHYIHIVIEHLSTENAQCLTEPEHKIQIFVRNSKPEHFPYESAIHLILQRLKCRSLALQIFLFEEVDDFEIFLCLVDFFKSCYNSDISVEKNETHFIVRKDKEMLLQTVI